MEHWHAMLIQYGGTEEKTSGLFPAIGPYNVIVCLVVFVHIFLIEKFHVLSSIRNNLSLFSFLFMYFSTLFFY